MIARPVRVVPLKDQLLIRLMAVDTETKGGLVIPGQAQEQRPIGHVVDAGPDCECVEIGDAVLFRGSYVLTNVKVWENEQDVDYFLCAEADVVASVTITGIETKDESELDDDPDQT